MSNLSEKLGILRAQASSVIQADFPLDRSGCIRAVAPEWTEWVQRVKALISSEFKPDSAPSALVKAGLRIRVYGLGPEWLERARSFFIRALDRAIEIACVDTFGELRGASVMGGTFAKSNKVFVVHGHDYASKSELEIFLDEIGLVPVVLHRQADAGQTLIEKFEKHSDVGYALILVTPDDPVVDPTSMEIVERRARQNVIFEWGYFVAHLGRDRVCCVYQEGAALPSDLKGLVYKPFNKHVDEVKYELVKELKAAGYELSI